MGYGNGEGASRARGGRLFVECYPEPGFPLNDGFLGTVSKSDSGTHTAGTRNIKVKSYETAYRVLPRQAPPDPL
jgi:hypothetical protein